MNNLDNSPPAQDSRNLLVLVFNAIISNWTIIAGSVFCCVLVALVSLKISVPIYKVEAMVIENSVSGSDISSGPSSGSSVISNMLAQTHNMPEVDEFDSLLSSPEVAKILENKYHLTREVFSSAWDGETGNWKPAGKVEEWKDWVRGILGVPMRHNPNVYDLARFISSNVVFNRPTVGSVMSISMMTDRPKDAQKWLKIIIDEVSDIIRTQMIGQRQSYVDYLQQQLSQSTLTSSRDAIIGVLTGQYRSLMILRSAKTFPLQQIQPPTTGDLPVNKSLALHLMLGAVGGLLLAGILIALRLSGFTSGYFLGRLHLGASRRDSATYQDVLR